MRLTGRCYCGHVSVAAPEVLTVARCHCADCRRWTGAPAPVFVAVSNDDLSLSPDIPERGHRAGVWRRHCPESGSALTARFDYLPGQAYLPVGLLDQAADLAPQVECHTASALPWVHIDPNLPSADHSARDTMNMSGP